MTSEHRHEHTAISGLGEDAVSMETARDDGRDTPLVVVPARMSVEVAQFVHSVAAEVFVEASRCPTRSPVDEGSAPAGQRR